MSEPAETNVVDRPLSRRKIFAAAVATVPVIATLPSGAALARSSNVISAASEADAIDGRGRTLCLDLRSGTEYDMASMDLGQQPYGLVTAINDRDYRLEPKGSAAQIREGEMCRTGGTFYYQSNGWQQAQVPRGMLVSATALSSFGGGIYYTEI